MANKTPNLLDLDALVASTLDASTEIQNAMTSNDENDMPETFTKQEIVDKETGSTIDFNYIYHKLSEMIDNANDALKLLQAIQPDPSDFQTVNAVTSMMNVIKGCISEFTRIHAQHIKFEHQIELENLRLANRLKYVEERRKLQETANSQKTEANINVNSAELIEFLQWKKQKEKEKEEKINRI